MNLTEEEKKELELKIVAAVIDGLKSQELKIPQLYHMAEAIIAKVDHVRTHGDFVKLLEELSERWNVFGSLLEEEREHARKHARG